jgi:hypothetical protein
MPSRVFREPQLGGFSPDSSAYCAWKPLALMMRAQVAV